MAAPLVSTTVPCSEVVPVCANALIAGTTNAAKRNKILRFIENPSMNEFLQAAPRLVSTTLVNREPAATNIWHPKNGQFVGQPTEPQSPLCQIRCLTQLGYRTCSRTNERICRSKSSKVSSVFRIYIRIITVETCVPRRRKHRNARIHVERESMQADPKESAEN